MKSKEKKPMSSAKRIFSVIFKILIVLVCLAVIAVAVFAVMFKDTFMNIVENPSIIPYVFENLGSLTRGLKTSTDDLDSEVKANAEAQAKAFAEADINLTETDIGNLSDENLTEAERAEIIYNAISSGISDTKPDKETENTENSEDNNTEDTKDSQNQVKTDDTLSEKDEELPKETVPSNKTAETDKPDVKIEKPAQSQQSMPEDKKNASSTAAPVQSDPSLKMSEEQYNTRVSELVAKMYSIKADFISQLSAFESRIISEYKALPEEQRTSATKAKIVANNMSYVMGLEAQCDAQVKAVTDELTAIMTANGKNTTLVDQINSAYISEKEIKKAYYVSLYK